MSRIALLALMLAVGVTSGAQTPPQVPTALLGAAASDPKTFVHLLGETKVPAGLEMRQGDFVRASNSPRQWDPAQWTPDRLARQQTVAVDRIVATFNEGHEGYRAAIVDGVVVVRPLPRGTSYLDSKPVSGAVAAHGLMRFAEKIFAPLDNHLDRPGGRAGSSIGTLGPPIDRGESVDVSIDATGRTVLEILNAVARQAPGHPWLVVSSDTPSPRPDRFGFLHGQGTTSELPLN